MPGQMPIALLAIVFGALETAGGAQELIYVGILRSRTEPLVIGTLGTVAGALLLAAGIALLVRVPLARTLVAAAAYVSVPVFILSGVVKHYAGWPITVVGIAYPLFLFLLSQRANKTRDALSKP
jgi:hypothetical protein